MKSLVNPTQYLMEIKKMAAPKTTKLNADGTVKVRKKPAPRKQFAIYKLDTDEAGQPKLASLEFTRNPMALVEALQRGDGSKFMQVELKK